MKKNEYKCGACGGVFEKGWSDEEAQAEADAAFSQESLGSDPAIVCDDCYKTIMG